MIFKDDEFKLFFIYFFFTVEENRQNCLSELENNLFFYLFFYVERILKFIEQGMLLWNPYSVPTAVVW